MHLKTMNLEEEITPQKIKLIPMEPPNCVEFHKQPSDIGLSCHMYTFNLKSSDFTIEKWVGLFARNTTNIFTFQKLIEKKCISNIVRQRERKSNIVLYLNNQKVTKIADMEVLHSAKIDSSCYLSRMSIVGNHEKIYSHQIGAVQKQYSPECDYKPEYSKYVYVVFCRLTDDIDLLLKILRECQCAEVYR